jgi:hypothetical protein
MDKIFKIGLLVLGFSFLAYLYCPHTNQAGRYRHIESGSSMKVFDTSSGDIYMFDVKSKQSIRTNIVTGDADIVKY